MGTASEEQNAQRANDKNQKNDSNGSGNANAKRDPAGNPVDGQELVGGMSTDSPTNQQPSASQHNQWEQEHSDTGSAPITGQQGSEGYEDQSKPAGKFRSTEDEDLEAEQSRNLQSGKQNQENDLERTDQDYRDGENRSGEDQDDDDELRTGK
ncbi:MAG: hypothetical protein V4708_04260 [Bacteroidota bacterium]